MNGIRSEYIIGWMRLEASECCKPPLPIYISTFTAIVDIGCL